MFLIILSTFLFLLFGYIIHFLVIKPYMAIRYYKKQGFKMSYFFPIFGFLKLKQMDIDKHHDFQYYRKHLIENYPGTKGIITNLFQHPLLIISDTALKKDFFAGVSVLQILNLALLSRTFQDLL